ncbi:MAG: hypothetical protein IPP58_13410 [Holophagaceae bacterium]|uniref:Uncharacterized protein n=1 Tax=Candidatus Geothrix skivensis TaxID=2954439 RepID=A0A9D7SIH6_9BACT|nr:hypothetical protein [Candidatus Geothrix skivensis]
MRTLALLALATLAVLPLSAHGHGRHHRPWMEFRESCGPAYGWEARQHEVRRHGDRRWEDRWEDRYRDQRWERYDRDHRCEEPRVILRPLAPPFVGRVVVRFR